MPRPAASRTARLEPIPFRLNRNGAPDSCFDAFSSREPVSTSLENALASRHPQREKAGGRYATGLLLQLPVPGVRFRCDSTWS
ncbi:hypothetical protein DXU07_43425 [Bradyrhizobium elkanii]|nr:hypothetical protein [Bradyrhizobium elkanii]